jgi:predicted ATPase
MTMLISAPESSYLPFLEMLKRDVSVQDDDDAASSWKKLERRVRALFSPAEVAEVLPYLATLLSLPVRGEFEERVKYLDGLAIGRQLFRSARAYFERAAREQPLVALFEDWHWADQSSGALLEHILPLVEHTPILFCVVTRPDQSSPGLRVREAIDAHGLKDRYTEVTLVPLTAEDSERLIANLVGADTLSARARDAILRKVEGNPFFLEEVVRALIDMGVLVRTDATAGWRATQTVEQVAIPDTLHGVIMSRVDRLSDDLKQLLKVAAVIGRSFFYRVLRAVSDPEAEIEQRLLELQQFELIREKRQTPELEYIFKHALVQEATYESILAERRRRLHREVAQSIESLFAGRLDELSGVLADHYARAEDWEKAQEYLFKPVTRPGVSPRMPKRLNTTAGRWKRIHRYSVTAGIPCSGRVSTGRSERRSFDAVNTREGSTTWSARWCTSGARIQSHEHRCVARLPRRSAGKPDID